MKTHIFLIIVILSGASSGLIYGTVNYVIVEPYLDQAIGLENQNLFDLGIEENTLAFQANHEEYRTWQKSGQILASVILGISIGSLFGIVFALSRNSLPGSHHVHRSLLLSVVMWFAIYLIPFLKYPANPPTVGETETVLLRTILYISFVAISGAGIIIFYKLSKKINKKFLAVCGYAALIIAAFILMPENPDAISAPMTLVNEFRLMSLLGISSLWVSLGVIFGLLWNRLESPNVSI